jgi:hypothetical protein
MSGPFHSIYTKAVDTVNPYDPRTEAFELFEIGRYYRQHGKIYEPVRSVGGGIYKGCRSEERFRFNYEMLGIEPVARIEQGRGR